MSVCFIAGGVTKALQVSAFTLAWTHSVERTDWQEDWRVTAAGLTLSEARIKGSGAGVDPAPDARLSDGWWRWNPAPAGRDQVVLGNSDAAGSWLICVAGTCLPLPEIMGIAAAGHPVVMQRCGGK
jgi:hypothetical protein